MNVNHNVCNLSDFRVLRVPHVIVRKKQQFTILLTTLSASSFVQDPIII
jgi:hypothetical protein